MDGNVLNLRRSRELENHYTFVIHQRAAFGAVVDRCGFTVDEIVFPHSGRDCVSACRNRGAFLVHTTPARALRLKARATGGTHANGHEFVYRRPTWARCIARPRNFDVCYELSLAMKFAPSDQGRPGLLTIL
jgi:hypothetical protein